MSVTTHDRISVSGKLQIENVLSFAMKQEAGIHASAHLRGILSEDSIGGIGGKLEGETYNIYDTDSKTSIFDGIIDKAQINYENGYYVIDLDLLAGSWLLDLEKKSRSFQNTKLTYDEIIGMTLAEFPLAAAVLASEISGKKTGYPIIRYRETAWEFIKRLASHYHLPVFSDVRSGEPRVYVGVPRLYKSASFQGSAYKVGFGKAYWEAGGATGGLDKKDFLRYNIEDGHNHLLGCDSEFQGKKFSICGKSCSLEKDILKYEYLLADRKYCYVQKLYNPCFAGMSLLGRVLRSEKDSVRLKLDIDNGDQDDSTAYPYPWVPETGNLMYLMPKAGSRVSLYFGDDDEKNGRAINCIRENAPKPYVDSSQSSLEDAAAAPVLAEDPDASFENTFSPEYRELRTEFSKYICLHPKMAGFQARGTFDYTRPNAIYNCIAELRAGFNVSLKSPKGIQIMAAGNIQINGKNIVIEGLTTSYLGRGQIVQELDLSTNEFNAEWSPTSELCLLSSNKRGVGILRTGAMVDVRYRARLVTAHDSFNDAPVEQDFDWGGLFLKIAIGIAVVAAVAAVTALTFGAGALAAGAAGAAALKVGVFAGTSVMVAGSLYVASQAVSDVRRGAVSGIDAYIGAAVMGSAIGIINAATGMIPGVSGSIVAILGVGLADGVAVSVFEQMVTTGKIDWSKVVKDGVFSAGANLITAGIFKSLSKLKRLPKGGAGALDDVLDDAVKVKGTLSTQQAEEYAFDAIKGSNKSDAVMLGKFEPQSSASYDKIAKAYDCNYFELDNWEEISDLYPREEIWKINERFLDIQTSSGREIYLSHNPYKYMNDGSFYSQEIQYLLDNNYTFMQEGEIWHAIIK